VLLLPARLAAAVRQLVVLRPVVLRLLEVGQRPVGQRLRQGL
jgi:hypothetical protein